MRSAPPVRVLIADDHQLFAESLGLTLNLDERLELVGAARNGKEAVRLAEELHPDVVLMDLEMPVLDGVEATLVLRRSLPDCQVVVLTASLAVEDAHRARSAGAAAYLTTRPTPSRRGATARKPRPPRRTASGEAGRPAQARRPVPPAAPTGTHPGAVPAPVPGNVPVAVPPPPPVPVHVEVPPVPPLPPLRVEVPPVPPVTVPDLPSVPPAPDLPKLP